MKTLFECRTQGHALTRKHTRHTLFVDTINLSVDPNVWKMKNVVCLRELVKTRIFPPWPIWVKHHLGCGSVSVNRCRWHTQNNSQITPVIESGQWAPEGICHHFNGIVVTGRAGPLWVTYGPSQPEPCQARQPSRTKTNRQTHRRGVELAHLCY